MPCAVKGHCEGVQGRTPSMVVLFSAEERKIYAREMRRFSRRYPPLSLA